MKELHEIWMRFYNKNITKILFISISKKSHLYEKLCFYVILGIRIKTTLEIRNKEERVLTI